MPYQTTRIPPELFLEHDGVKIYHTYRDGEADQRRSFWYTTDEDENENNEFDIRDINIAVGRMGLVTEGDHKRVLKTAIERGIICAKGVVAVEEQR